MLAIYNRPGSFSDRWIDRCTSDGIDYVLIDFFEDELIDKLKRLKVTKFLTHPPMYSQASLLSSRNIITACNQAGIEVFPTLNDYWHFDDKIAQKYIFEALNIPTPRTYVFYDRDSAMEWVNAAEVPYVFKLKSGAGSINVSLIREKRDAKQRVNRMFGTGYAATDSVVKDISTKIRLHRSRRDWIGVAKRLPATLRKWISLRNSVDKERGYIYFQKFIPQNDHDTRVTVIGDRAFAFRRRVRPGDFRASGSGSIDYDTSLINKRCIQIAFDAAHSLGARCMAFDFVEDQENCTPLVVEMSFAFIPEAVHGCPGYWRSDMTWVPGHVWPQDIILIDHLNQSKC